jgi:aminoglycoside phosphotransferase family enzyme
MSEHEPTPGATGPSEAAIVVAEKVAYLRGLGGPGDEVVETHFAWVFLLGERALKLRKPVRRDTMDYSTIAARHADSEAEVRLNRRLARDVYLGTVPLVRAAGGRLGLGGDGEVIDWLVEMRRLDRRWMLDAALERGEASQRALERVADLLVAFYASAAPVCTGPGAFASRLATQVELNGAALRALDPSRAGALREKQRSVIASLAPTLDARAARGCVVEAHGDLRPEHILLAEPPAVIDCLEFDRDLRLLDRAEELCFLDLECARLGHPATGRWLLATCLARLADDAPPRLLDFYRSHRAATRAKLYAWRADEPDGGTPGEWRARASAYLDAALAAVR